jgi:hypothetical protein
MYRIKRADGSLTDLINLTRARDAAQSLVGYGVGVPVQAEAG